MEDADSKQQELPPWKSEEPTPAGPSLNSHAPQEHPERDPEAPMMHSIAASKKDGCCHRLVQRCGPIGWYFSPMFDKLGYSMLTTLYHAVMFPYTLATFIAVVTMFSVSVGLLVLICGFILYWWTCEISIVLARIDLALSYYMVEDNPDLIASRRLLKLNLYKRIAPCPCSKRSQVTSGCDRLLARMKSTTLTWDTYKIFLFHMIFKPLIVGLTWWICIFVAYVGACIFAPVVYIAYSPIFTERYWCPFGDTSCDNNVCDCQITSIDNFWGALLFGFCAFLLLPLVLHISIWFAKVSKMMSYYWLSNYYNGDIDAERNSLLVKSKSGNNSNANSRDNSISNNNNNAQVTGIVHSTNNPYTNDV